MKRKFPQLRRPVALEPVDRPIRNEHSGEDFFFMGQACLNAARALAHAPHETADLIHKFDLYPAWFMYRHAVELYLKSMILGEGGNFLNSRPDRISVGKSRSVSWLAQFVVQIVTAVGWEAEFRCDGVDSLGEFKKIIEDVNDIDVGDGSIRQRNGIPNPTDFLRRLDALVVLLERTADALAAEWHLRSEGSDDEMEDRYLGVKPTIH